MIRKVKLFFALSPEEKKLFLEAYILLGLMRVAILMIPFKRITRSLSHSTEIIKQNALTDEQLHAVKLVGKVIAKAANNTPWESACLAQALTAQRILKKRNIPGVFYLGVKKNAKEKEKLEAHAWAQCGETIVTGQKGYKAFTVLAVYGWGPR